MLCSAISLECSISVAHSCTDPRSASTGRSRRAEEEATRYRQFAEALRSARPARSCVTLPSTRAIVPTQRPRLRSGRRRSSTPTAFLQRSVPASGVISHHDRLASIASLVPIRPQQCRNAAEKPSREHRPPWPPPPPPEAIVNPNAPGSRDPPDDRRASPARCRRARTTPSRKPSWCCPTPQPGPPSPAGGDIGQRGDGLYLTPPNQAHRGRQHKQGRRARPPRNGAFDRPLPSDPRTNDAGGTRPVGISSSRNPRTGPEAEAQHRRMRMDPSTTLTPVLL